MTSILKGILIRPLSICKTICLRHPRYALALLLILVTSVYLLIPIRPDVPLTRLRLPPRPGPWPYENGQGIGEGYGGIGNGNGNGYGGGGSASGIADRELVYRLEQAESIYQKTIEERDGLIRRYGPHPSDIQMFPPNKSPWPAYTVWDFFPPTFNCPHEVRRLGALGDGGKWICGISRVVDKKDCVVYSIGINQDSSLEASILLNTNHCKIYAYDASDASASSPSSAERRWRKGIPFGMGGRTSWRAGGLAGEGQGERSGEGDVEEEKEGGMYSLRRLMEMNGHTHIDILKVDIEGREFDVVTRLIKDYLVDDEPLPFGQMTLEIHAWDRDPASFERMLKWWEGLEESGLRPFWSEPNLVYVNYATEGKPQLAEYSFLNIKGDNVFIRNPPQ